MINPGIFREYDIRGIAEHDLTSSSVRELGRGFAAFIRPKHITTVAVGYDARLSSPRIRDAFIEGLVQSGMTVTDLGLCPTPALYFSLYHDSHGAGVMITGSHNPPEYNGFKLCVGKDTIHGEDIQDLRRLIEANGNDAKQSIGKEGSVSRKSILPEYINYLKSKFPINHHVPLKVVLDAGNGTAGLAAPEIMRDMGCEVVELYSEPDGSFPNHHPDPTVPKNLATLIAAVKKTGAALGISFDGDADRIGVVDEKGSILWGDQLMVIFARDILRDLPGATFVSEVKCSQTMYDDIRKHGGNAIMWKTGHSLIKAKMKEVHASLAGEMSGHLFFADRYYGYDDAIYAACRIVEILKKGKLAANSGTLSMLLADLPKTYNTPEIRFDCPDDLKFKVVEQAKKLFSEGTNIPIKLREVITVDGVRAIFDKGWGLIRASNTQPVLVMRFEAQDEVSLDAIKTMMEQQVEKIIKAIRSSGAQ